MRCSLFVVVEQGDHGDFRTEHQLRQVRNSIEIRVWGGVHYVEPNISIRSARLIDQT